MDIDETNLVLENLHSTMLSIKYKHPHKAITILINLHSTMLSIKSNNFSVISSVSNIYIPLCYLLNDNEME